MARKIVRDRVQPIRVGGGEPAASDPVSPGEEEGLASLAALSGLVLSNRSVTAFVQSFTDGSVDVRAAQ